jgi:hypothetical protein
MQINKLQGQVGQAFSQAFSLPDFCPRLLVVRFLWQATRGYRLAPWRSPYLRWRIETYQGLHAERIGFREFAHFAWSHRHDLMRFLRWTSRMENSAGMPRNNRSLPPIH